MKELMVRGKQEFMGVEIPVVEGGFGEGQRVVLAKNIAEVHNVETKYVNKLINNNIEEFEFGVDILDLKTGSFKELVLENGLLTKAQWGNANNVYLLSEQGYMLLVGFMDTEKAKEIRKQLRREYFAMREIINSNEQLKANLLLSIYNGGQEGVLASKQLTEMEVKEATTPLLAKIEEDKPLVDLANKRIDVKGTISITEATKTFELKRGQITNWAKDNGYIHKTIVEVNKKGEGYFKVVGVEHKNIAILPEGINLIREYLEEIRNFKTRR